MTEVSTIKDADYIVRVRAQVMTRDDSSGGWVPMGGGGMSEVGLRKIVLSSGSDDLHHEYHIHGQKISDRSVVLNCVLKKDVQYIKANPTFHHWRTEEKRFGLTFQSSAEARAFDKGVKKAVEDLIEGYNEANSVEVGDDEVFMSLELPLGRQDSWSASTVSTTTSSPSPQSPAFSLHDTFAPPNHLHRMHYINRPPPPPRPSPPPPPPTTTDIWKHDKLHKPDQADDNLEITDFSYVEFNRNKCVHEYSYPTLECVSKSISSGSPSSRRGSLVKMEQPPLPIKAKKKKAKLKKGSGKKHLLSQRSRCVYCHEMFVHDENARGQCEDAPDKVGECIERVACICCARGLLYHCMADADGDYGHPCVCDSSDEANCRKWSALSILSLIVPCLWCYWPLTACHKCGVACGCCGGRHKATV